MINKRILSDKMNTQRIMIFYSFFIIFFFVIEIWREKTMEIGMFRQISVGFFLMKILSYRRMKSNSIPKTSSSTME